MVERPYERQCFTEGLLARREWAERERDAQARKSEWEGRLWTDSRKLERGPTPVAVLPA